MIEPIKLVNNLIQFCGKCVYFSFVIAACYMLTAIFTDSIAVLVGVVILVLALVWFCRKPVNKLISHILKLLDKLTMFQMILIIIVVILVSRALYETTLVTDFSSFSDMAVYTRMANEIASGAKTTETVLYTHVGFMALFIALPKMVGISYQMTMLISFMLGTIFYFLTFTKMFGKNKSFLATMIYLISPASILFSYLITHEIFFYFFSSVIFYSYFRYKENTNKSYLYFSVLLLFLFLNSMISPMTIVLVITLLIFEIATAGKVYFKFINVLLITFIFLISNTLAPKILSYYSTESFSSSSPAMCNFLVGSNLASAGSFNTEDMMELKNNLERNSLIDNTENRNQICKELLVQRVYNYSQNPIQVVKLIASKIYVNWKGPFHPLEVGASIDRTYNKSQNTLLYWILTAITQFLYLGIVAVGFMRMKWKTSERNLSLIFTCCLLGVFGVLIFIESMNKYTLHQMLLITMISVSFWDNKAS